jgi:hypothetical protein
VVTVLYVEQEHHKLVFIGDWGICRSYDPQDVEVEGLPVALGRMSGTLRC